MKEKISIIIPVYNVSDYLECCINSVINQSYDNLEIILVDDGSTDNSGEICDKFAKLDKRIQVIHKKNGGLSDARNYGIKVASGEYIAFLDSDDWIHKDLYETLYYLAKEYSSDITVCNFKRVYNEEEKLNFCSDKIDIYSNIEALEQVYKDKYLQMIVAWNKLYKRKLFNDLRYPIGRIHEDEFLTPILLHKSNKIVYINKELIYYRQRNGSIMNSGFTIKKLDYLYALSNRLEYYKTQNMELFYRYDLKIFLNTNIKYYFKLEDMDILDKSNIMVNLRKNILNIGFKDISNKDIIKILLFKYYPNILKKLKFR